MAIASASDNDENSGGGGREAAVTNPSFSSDAFVRAVSAACALHYEELHAAATSAFGGESGAGCVFVLQIATGDGEEQRVGWAVHMVYRFEFASYFTDDLDGALERRVFDNAGVTGDRVVHVVVACGGDTPRASMRTRTFLLQLCGPGVDDEIAAMAEAPEARIVRRCWDDGIEPALKIATTDSGCSMNA